MQKPLQPVKIPVTDQITTDPLQLKVIPTQIQLKTLQTPIKIPNSRGYTCRNVWILKPSRDNKCEFLNCEAHFELCKFPEHGILSCNADYFWAENINCPGIVKGDASTLSASIVQCLIRDPIQVIVDSQ